MASLPVSLIWIPQASVRATCREEQPCLQHCVVFRTKEPICWGERYWSTRCESSTQHVQTLYFFGRGRQEDPAGTTPQRCRVSGKTRHAIRCLNGRPHSLGQTGRSGTRRNKEQGEPNTRPERRRSLAQRPQLTQPKLRPLGAHAGDQSNKNARARNRRKAARSRARTRPCTPSRRRPMRTSAASGAKRKRWGPQRPGIAKPARQPRLRRHNRASAPPCPPRGHD